MKPVYTPKSSHEKALQRALIQYRNPANRDLVREALRKAHREDLIGFGPKCLVRPGDGRSGGPGGGKGGKGGKGAKGAHGAGISGNGARGGNGGEGALSHCRRRAVVPKLARRSMAVKAVYRKAGENMSARIVPTPAMAQSALAVSGA